MDSDLALLVVKATLSKLGYAETVKQLDVEIDLKHPLPDALKPLLFAQWLHKELNHGYDTVILTLEGRNVATVHNSYLPSDMQNTLQASILLYFVKRAKFLSMVYADMDEYSQEYLIVYIKDQLLPLLDRINETIDESTLETAFAGVLDSSILPMLTRERESQLLQLIVNRDSTPSLSLGSEHLRNFNLLGVGSTPESVKETLLNEHLRVFFKKHNVETKKALEVPEDYLSTLIEQAGNWRRFNDPFYLPQRRPLTAQLLLSEPYTDVVSAVNKEQFPMKPIQSLSLHTNEVWCVQFSPLGHYLATGSRDGSIIIYDVTTTPIQQLAVLSSTDIKDELAFTEWSFRPAKLDTPSPEHRGVVCCAWDDTESYIVTCGLDTVVRVWEVKGLQGQLARRITRSNISHGKLDLVCCFVLGEHIRARSCKFVPNQHPHQVGYKPMPSFAVGSPDKALKIFDIEGNEIYDFFYDTLIDESATDGNGTEDLQTIEASLKAIQKNFNRVVDFSITPDGKYLVSANNDRLVQFYSIPDLLYPDSRPVKICSLTFRGKPNSTSISANGKYVLLSISQEIQLWDISDLANGKPIITRKYIGHRIDDNVIRAGFGYLNPGGEEELVLSGSTDGCVYIWKLQTGQLIARVKAHTGLCNSVDWNRFYPLSADPTAYDFGSMWCSVGDDKLARVWGK